MHFWLNYLGFKNLIYKLNKNEIDKVCPLYPYEV